MCEAVTGFLAAYGGYIAAAGAAIGGYSAYESGQTTKKAGEYNQEINRQKSMDALNRGAIEAADRKDRARRVAGAQAEAAAMSGVRIDTGTPLALLTETAGLGELDALRTVHNAQRSAWGFDAQGGLDKYQGDAAGRGGILTGAGTFLGGASSAYYGSRGVK